MPLTNETLQLRAKAKRKGIKNYGSMSAAELRSALEGGSKRKSAANLGGKRKSASAVTKRTSSTRKSAKKAPAAKSPSRGKAKRSSSGGTRKSSSTAKTMNKARSTRKIGTNAKTQPRNSTGTPGRNLIDRSQIDWRVDWAGGESGNRGIIMKALRKHRGNYAKVYDALKGNARKMFPKSSKTGEKYSADKSRAQLKWYIGRTAFDYVTATEQHQKSTNRKADRRTNGKATGSRQTRKTGSGRSSSTRKTAKAQTASRKRTAASQRAGGKTRKSTKRKSVKR